MDILHRLQHALREALERAGPSSRSPTIADVYQHLVPYRAIRGELGVWELAEYEHALLRLLAGEGGHLSVTAPEAVDEFRRELASPNPILGIYRDYPGVEVRLGGASVPVGPGGSGTTDVQPGPERADARPVERAAEVASEPHAACFACGTELPPESGLRYCPACGADQRTGPCRECGQTLNVEWNFCIRCGTPRQGERGGRRPE